MKDSMFLCDLFLMPVVMHFSEYINCSKYILYINFVSKLASLTTAVSKLNNLLNGFTLIFRDIF